MFVCRSEPAAAGAFRDTTDESRGDRHDGRSFCKRWELRQIALQNAPRDVGRSRALVRRLRAESADQALVSLLPCRGPQDPSCRLRRLDLLGIVRHRWNTDVWAPPVSRCPYSAWAPARLAEPPSSPKR